MKNPVTTIRPNKENTYIGNIQVSKGMLWAKLKRAQEEAEHAKLFNKIFPNRGPSLTKKNQQTSTSERPSLKTSGSATSFRSCFSVKTKNTSPRESFRSTKLEKMDFGATDSKLMKQSKKIAKYQPSTEGPQYKRVAKKPVKDITKKIPKKIFKEDIKRSSSQNSKENLSKSMTTTRSIDFRNLSESANKEVQFNKYRAAMRARKVTCETLRYRSLGSKKELKFRCFKEKDLGIPKQYSTKIIHHNMDNDCYTDDEQMKLAVKNLYFSLRLANEEII